MLSNESRLLQASTRGKAFVEAGANTAGKCRCYDESPEKVNFRIAICPNGIRLMVSESGV